MIKKLNIRCIHKKLIGLLFLIFPLLLNAQEIATVELSGKVTCDGEPVPFANLVVKGTRNGVATDINGNYRLKGVHPGQHQILISAVGYLMGKHEINVLPNVKNQHVELTLIQSDDEIEEVVVTATMKETYIKDSPIKVQVLSPRFLEKSPVNNVIEAVQTVNGVQEQINCGVCGTNDIHINGMEGPYTLVLIDGMPIVSALASVYGFNGIPNSLIKRVEIVKGPASSLYGSEAMGGVINIITKDPDDTEILNMNSFITSHGEYNLDAGSSLKVSDKVHTMLSANYYLNQYRMDFNGDNFTDIPLNNRLSLFNKWSVERKKGRKTTAALRFYTEDRFGGEMNWNRTHRGGTDVYGESIYTNRLELIGTYQLPLKEHIRIDYSANIHDQNSYYGNTLYDADQKIAFANFIWDKSSDKHELLVGATARYQYYDDNTIATVEAERRFIPGVFVQEELKLKKDARILLGGRLDHHQDYGLVPAPRIAFKMKPGNWTTARLNMGRGFRLVNLFTEDHAALSGSRTVVIAEALKPEQSYNVNLNLNHVYLIGNSMGTIDFDAFYTYFSNKIIPDYESDDNLIIYDNLDGNAVVRGFAFSVEQKFEQNFNFKIGCTYQDVFEMDVDNETAAPEKIPQLFAPRFSGTFVNSYSNKKYNFSIDWTGRVMGKQHLPTYDAPYTRAAISPVYTIQNIQFTKEFKTRNMQVYFAIKNIWSFTQASPLVAWQNPFGDSFDTAYAYGPLQPRRYVIGVRKRILRNQQSTDERKEL